jgi:hypothetical protein
MRRIKPEEVDDAYERCGMRPTQKEFCDIVANHCCGLTAVAIADYGADAEKNRR